jgi:hypothetical protein
VTEAQREPVPRDDADERDTALAFLAFARHCLIKKTEGLSDEQLRRVLVGSGTNLLGLVQHVTVGERWWFQHHVAGRLLEQEWDFSMAVPADRSSDLVFSDFHEAVAASDEIIAATDLEAPTVLPVDGRPKSLRWVIAHKPTEITRHAGHADILRELIDGTTGR